MHLDGRSRLRLGAASNRLYRWLAVLFPATLVGTVFGQTYIAPPSGFQGAPAVPAMGNVTPTTGQGSGQLSGQAIDQINQQANGTTASTGQGTPAVGEANAPKEATAGGPLAAPLAAMASWGAVNVHPHASYQFVYATGVHNAPGESTDTFTHTLTPGVTVNFGPHVTADYTPSIRFYSEKNFHDTVDHAVNLHAGYGYGDWTFGLSQDVLISDDPLVETSGQVQRNDYTTELLATYNMNEKVTLSTTAGVDLYYTSGGGTNQFVSGPSAAAAGLTDSQNYHGAESFDYKFNDHLSGGAQVSVGYNDQSGGFKSISEQYNLHVGWHPGTKFSATLSGGFDHQNFLDSKASDSWNPIYSANIGYHMFEQTFLSAYASESVNTSMFTDQLSVNTGVGVNLQQRLLGKLHLSLGFGYSKLDYQSTATTGLDTSRKDENLSYTAGLTVPFLTRCNFATFYQYSQNSSTQKGFSYDSSQVGVTLSWAY